MLPGVSHNTLSSEGSALKSTVLETSKQGKSVRNMLCPKFNYGTEGSLSILWMVLLGIPVTSEIERILKPLL